MDLVVQNAIEKAKRQHMRSNLPGAIDSLSEVLETCSEESIKLIYFEMAVYYHQYNYVSDSFSMLMKALDRGYNPEVIDKYILKHFSQDKKYEENYYHNTDLLSKYVYYKGKKPHNFDVLEKYAIYSDSSRTVFITQDNKITYETNTEPDIQSCTEGTIFFLDNCQNVALIFLLNKVSEKVNTRKSPFYVYFEQLADLECLLTFTKLDNFLIDNQALIFVGREETEAYFSDLQSLLPTHIFNNQIEPINEKTASSVLKVIADSRAQRIKRAFASISQYYSSNQKSVYSEIKNSNIKILFLSTRFDIRLADIVMQYYGACLKLGYKCQSIIEKSEISSSPDMEYVMIERFVPNIIFAVNTFRRDRAKYPKEVIFLTYLENIDNLDLKQLLSTITKNDFIFAGTVMYHKLFREGFPVTNIIEMPLIVDSSYIDKNPLRNLMYKCDVCIIADNADIGAIVSRIQSLLLEKYPDKEPDILNAINILRSKYLSLFFAEQYILGHKETKEMVAEVFESSGMKPDEELLLNLTDEFRIQYSRSLYNTTIANWLIRSGVAKVKLWGKEWQNIPSFRDYSLGPILSEEVLQKVLSNSKIVVGSDLYEADITEIYNSFTSGTMYLQNSLNSKDQLITSELGGKSDNGIQYFDNKQNLLNKIAYFSENENIRSEIVKKGKAFITLESAYKKNLPLIIKSITDSFKD